MFRMLTIILKQNKQLFPLSVASLNGETDNWLIGTRKYCQYNSPFSLHHSIFARSACSVVGLRLFDMQSKCYLIKDKHSIYNLKVNSVSLIRII